MIEIQPRLKPVHLLSCSPHFQYQWIQAPGSACVKSKITDFPVHIPQAALHELFLLDLLRSHFIFKNQERPIQDVQEVSGFHSLIGVVCFIPCAKLRLRVRQFPINAHHPCHKRRAVFLQTDSTADLLCMFNSILVVLRRKVWFFLCRKNVSKSLIEKIAEIITLQPLGLRHTFLKMLPGTIIFTFFKFQGSQAEKDLGFAMDVSKLQWLLPGSHVKFSGLFLLSLFVVQVSNIREGIHNPFPVAYLLFDHQGFRQVIQSFVVVFLVREISS